MHSFICFCIIFVLGIFRGVKKEKKKKKIKESSSKCTFENGINSADTCGLSSFKKKKKNKMEKKKKKDFSDVNSFGHLNCHNFAFWWPLSIIIIMIFLFAL